MLSGDLRHESFLSAGGYGSRGGGDLKIYAFYYGLRKKGRGGRGEAQSYTRVRNVYAERRSRWPVSGKAPAAVVADITIITCENSGKTVTTRPSRNVLSE